RRAAPAWMPLFHASERPRLPKAAVGTRRGREKALGKGRFGTKLAPGANSTSVRTCRRRRDRAARHLHPAWLLLCLGGELVAYAGYVLAVRDTAKVDNGPSLTFGRSVQTVVAGFGVFAATRTSGGFAVDYWALRSAGEDRDGAVARVLALGALEYAVLAPAALCSAIALLISGEDVPLTLTLPWLLVIPGAF